MDHTSQALHLVLTTRRHDEASEYLTVACTVDARVTTLAEVAEAAFPLLVAISAPVKPCDIPDAERLTLRALHLAERGLIPATAIIHCADHDVLLWLHAEPTLRDRLADRLLAPLAAEGTHRRMMLALTLLAWLERRPSAPALAEELGVHPQTIRHRLKCLDRLLDVRLVEQDTETSFAMLLALKATLPLWEVEFSRATGRAARPREDQPAARVT